MIRRIPGGIAIVVFGLLLGAEALAAANPLANSGFENNPQGETKTLPGWTAYGGNAYGETGAARAHSGTNYFKVYQAFNGQVNYTGVYQDYISGPGAAYAVSGWAYTLSSDKLAGQNAAWLEVTFRDARNNVLALYHSASITTNALAGGAFPVNTWNLLAVTNQLDPVTFAVTNTTATLVAPPGTYYLRCQIVFQGDAAGSGGSVYFDDLNLDLRSAAPYGDWNIVWSDEFAGTAVNSNIWTYDLGNGGSNPGWGNNEHEYYTARTNNVRVADGCLHLIAQKESYNGFHYTSARLKTQNLFSWKYGRFEWRAQLPAGVGFWPALWMLGTNITDVGWPGCGEVDVVENKGSDPGTVQGSLHSGSDETGYYHFPPGAAATDFHTYTLDWTSNTFLFYVDGQLYQRQTGWGSATANAYPFPFDQPFFLILNLAVGGNYLGNPDLTTIDTGTTFPGEMLVDYVRIYRPTAPLKLALTPNGTNLLLTWPTNIVCHVEMQTGTPADTNWMPLSSAPGQLLINPSSASAFYRLVSP